MAVKTKIKMADSAELKIIQDSSPNFSDRPERAAVNLLVLHYTGMKSCKEALKRLKDKEAKVSSHYLLDESGKIHQLVDDSKCAWHAGISHWRGKSDLNNTSIGIEIANPGHEFGYDTFTREQYASLIPLCKRLVSRYRIAPWNVVGHSDIAPDRKMDPGELFDWKLLASNGIGIWPEIKTPRKDEPLLTLGDEGYPVKRLKAKLSRIGYKVDINSFYDKKLKIVVTAFQRHFYPVKLDGEWSRNCELILDNLMSQVI